MAGRPRPYNNKNRLALTKTEADPISYIQLDNIFLLEKTNLSRQNQEIETL